MSKTSLRNEHLTTLFSLYPVFLKMDRNLVHGIVEDFSLTELKAGARVFGESEPCDAFPFVLSGSLRVFKQAENGREISLYSVLPGDVCAVTAGCILGTKPYSASGVAKTDCVLAVTTAGSFESLLEVRIFREFVFSLFSNRLQDLMQLVEAVAFQRLDRRLASLLLRREPHVDMTHQELADELGTVREMVSRVLKTFSDAGWIRQGRERIDIRDAEALRRMLDG